ncbi:virulence factor Mce family protein [Mycobacterium sp.]|jgi:phospholipid/cholesterol/gamma-HCH transport system substrate-binding protein|uniref:virulence factor Mce family protein n=1 Tax=Mycobacterium sp. TaxID=1785 RepID=UPI002D56B99E|nr:virulence factor Mce family protein [Mycobacterium sp.]HZA11325.1 virulence factor Mce family protein [Mycobacterium sp.]
MSTIFNIRNIKTPNVSRTSVIVISVIVVLGIIAAIVGWQLYRKLTNNSVVAYFPEALALYPGDKVQIMGVQVGAIDKIEPAGDKMKVSFHYANKFNVPANATASILNPTLVASRTIQLSPPYTGGPKMKSGAVIPIERTQVPVEWDELRNSINRILTGLGPTPEQPKGPFGDIIESAANGFAGKGKQINESLNALSEAATTLNQGRGDFFAITRSLALFVNALYQNDRQFVALNNDLSSFTNKFTNTDREVANTLRDLNNLLSTTHQFVDRNGEVLAHDVNNLADVTNAILQPEPRNGLETGLHVFPNLGANLVNISPPVPGGIEALPAVVNFANPMQFVCSAIQAGSRLGYQESAELCAQYLGPILDAIKFNYPPFGVNELMTASTLPKLVTYSEERLRPPGGYKDTTVPGIWSRDTLFSHGNHEPGWIVAPGMQGIQVNPFTERMLTPESLAELMGGPNIVAPPAPPAFGVPPGGNLPGSPNAYDQNNPLPPPWYPQPGPPPAPAPGVIPGDPGGSAVLSGPAPVPGPAAPAAPPPPGGYPAEAGR